MLVSHLLRPFFQRTCSSPPIWLMRQAGRYLPEYQEIRKKFPNFIELCLTPSAVCEITLQPINRFDFDAAIIFADILLIPYGLGQDVVFNDGPKLEDFQLHNLNLDGFEERLKPVMKAISLVRDSLSQDKCLIGFAGAPWTVAAYMLEQRGTKDFSQAKKIAFSNPEMFLKLLDLIVEATKKYLNQQIQAGVNVIQIFESWGGVVPDSQKHSWIFSPTHKIISFLKKNHPSIPIIGFARGLGTNLKDYLFRTGVDGISIDSTISLKEAFSLPCVIQGNLDPLALVAGGSFLQEEVRRILEFSKGNRHIFNLGHGVLPSTPIDNIYRVIEWIRDKGNS